MVKTQYNRMNDLINLVEKNLIILCEFKIPLCMKLYKHFLRI